MMLMLFTIAVIMPTVDTNRAQIYAILALLAHTPKHDQTPASTILVETDLVSGPVSAINLRQLPPELLHSG